MKTYRDNPQIGTVRHSVSFHDGTMHADGSPFFHIRIFQRRKDKETFIRTLKSEGYTAI